MRRRRAGEWSPSTIMACSLVSRPSGPQPDVPERLQIGISLRNFEGTCAMNHRTTSFKGTARRAVIGVIAVGMLVATLALSAAPASAACWENQNGYYGCQVVKDNPRASSGTFTIQWFAFW